MQEKLNNLSTYIRDKVETMDPKTKNRIIGGLMIFIITLIVLSLGLSITAMCTFSLNIFDMSIEDKLFYAATSAYAAWAAIVLYMVLKQF